MLKNKKITLSAGQKKLQSLNISLPPLPLSSTGSLPKSPELIDIRYRVAKGVQNIEDLKRKEKISTEMWLREQKRLGLDVLVDGELDRGDLISFTAKKIHGFEEGGTVRVYGNRYYKKPIIKSKIQWKEPISLEMWQFSQRTMNKPVKAVITGPYTLMDWSFNEFYRSKEECLADLTSIIIKEISTLTEAGAKIIQIDEPSISSQPEDFSLIQSAINKISGSTKAYIILHLCYGDISLLWPKIEKLKVDNFSIETTNSQFSFLSAFKKLPSKKDISLGFIDSHSHIVETSKEVEARIKDALKVIPASQLWLTPDCGLKTRTIKEATGKLESLVSAGIKTRTAIK